MESSFVFEAFEMRTVKERILEEGKYCSLCLILFLEERGRYYPNVWFGGGTFPRAPASKGQYSGRG